MIRITKNTVKTTITTSNIPNNMDHKKKNLSILAIRIRIEGY